MRRIFANNPLYLITDRTISGLTHAEIVRQAVDAGVRTVQLREKRMPKKYLYKEALFIRRLASRHKVTFIVNDYVDIALLVKADGVHLGQDDIPIREARRILGKDSIIGISTHSLKQAINAQAAGADYIGFGPIFHTSTKNAGRPRGVSSLVKIKRYIKIPVVAVGGITHENVSDVLNCGADAVAVISGLLAGNIKTNIKKFLNVALDNNVSLNIESKAFPNREH